MKVICEFILGCNGFEVKPVRDLRSKWWAGVTLKKILKLKYSFILTSISLTNRINLDFLLGFGTKFRYFA